jgi:hypothetical protein
VERGVEGFVVGLVNGHDGGCNGAVFVTAVLYLAEYDSGIKIITY